MAASDYVPIFFKNRLHLAGRPQMSTRPICDRETLGRGYARGFLLTRMLLMRSAFFHCVG